MKVKKLFALLLALLLVISAPFSASAIRTKDSVEVAPLGADIAPVGNNIDIMRKYIDDVDAFTAYVKAETMSFNETIYIGNFDIPMEPEAYTAIAYYVCKDLPDVFQVGSVGYSIMGGKLYNMNVEYLYTKEEYETLLGECEAVADEILSDILEAEHLSDVDKALLIHDRLALRCNYDHDLNHNNRFDIYGALVGQFAVCEGYTKAYIYLLDKVGIRSEICASEKLNHAWNIVYIDDIPYHVDVTWDDVIGLAGEVYHDNFLLSSAALYEGGSDIFVNGHVADDYNTTPCDTRYDEYFWQNSYTAFQLLDGEIYYVDSTRCSINKYTPEGNEELYKSRSYWNKYWNLYCRLSTDGDTLFYNTNTSVCEFNVDTLISTTVFEPEEVESALEIYGFEYKDGYLICDLAATNNYYNAEIIRVDKLYEKSSEEVPKVPASVTILTSLENLWVPTGYEIETVNLQLQIVYDDGASKTVADSFKLQGYDKNKVGQQTVYIVWEGLVAEFTLGVYALGDANGDGKLSVADATHIQKYLASMVELTDVQKRAAEVTGEGKLNVSDATKIQKYIAGIVKDL